ncbi:HD family phosphohydrolase [Oceanobacillus jeddahense]|uniref:HDIG domain-containing protein n=1 Tax=Oceanobacillus jeddahense TaxID=1462527 RepID=A0ABY5JM49_9BACI|nr:HDIG domain-containing metalloprotein [Oceanobacillus jeddahense]UUI01368.1 HDIG domain-containing protein [Oceanobacillus jeddahense]
MKKRWKKILPFFKNRRKYFVAIIPALLIGAIVFLTLLDNVRTDTYDIKRFAVSEETIRSPITIENKQETDQRIREAVNAVPDRYSISEEVTEERINYINEIFDAVLTLKEEHDEDTIEDMYEEEAIEIRSLLSEEISSEISEEVFISLLQQPEPALEEANTVFTQSLENVLNQGIRAENIQSGITNIERDLAYSELDENLQEILLDLADFAVVENSFFDYEATAQEKKDAATLVDPVVIRAGETIVREGQTITNEIYEQLELVGVLSQEGNIYPILALGFLAAVIAYFFGMECLQIAKERDWSVLPIIAVLLLSILAIFVMKIQSYFFDQSNALYLVTPIAAIAILLKVLISDRSALRLSILYSILAAFMFNNYIAGMLHVEAAIYFLFSQLAAIVLMKKLSERLVILKTAIGLILIHSAVIILFLFLSFEKYTWFDVFLYLAFGIVAACLSAILAIGLLPLFESFLGMLTDMKLLQLANPNQPLLKRLLVETPGTYHHSVMVANISETACEAVGANGLLARVGAYYHDIGKTVRPGFFIENQMPNNNPHDKLPPKESADIIIRHTTDGANLLKAHKMPKEIIDIAKQHHSNSVVQYFYMKAKELDPETEEADFRYPGPKPETKENAIVCICDSVEPAVRSLQEPTPETIDSIVSSIINSKISDGQLDNSPLTLKELKIIQHTVCDALKGIFHSRIQYPKKEGDK